MKELLLRTLDFLGFAYWVEITTDVPRCTYYFGPFIGKQEAKASQSGYVEDLQQESAQGIKVSVKRCKPHDLTIFDDSQDFKPFESITGFSSQIS